MLRLTAKKWIVGENRRPDHSRDVVWCQLSRSCTEVSYADVSDAAENSKLFSPISLTYK